MTRLLAFTAILTLTGAVSAHAAPPRHERPVAIGQAASVGGPVVTPLRVVEDSRCPMNARCVWAGRVVVHIRITHGRTRLERDVVLGQPVHVADGMLSLTAVTPARRTDQTIRPGDYRFSFMFQGGR